MIDQSVFLYFFTDRANRGKLLYKMTYIKYLTLAMLFNQYSFAFNERLTVIDKDDN